MARYQKGDTVRLLPTGEIDTIMCVRAAGTDRAGRTDKRLMYEIARKHLPGSPQVWFYARDLRLVKRGGK